MTDRINAYLVVLEKDIREDDAEKIGTALSMIKGVLTVTPNINSPSDKIAQHRARHEIMQKLLKVME